MFNKFLCCFIFLVCSTNAFSEDKYYPPTTPWHLADIWWKSSSETKNLQELSVDFEIIGKVDKDTLFYIAPVGLGKLNGIAFYGGIQTNAGGWNTKESRKIVKFGKGGIFSRWSSNGNPISLDYADGNLTTHYESAGYEGNFVSVRNKFYWKEGKYRYSVRKLKLAKVDGEIYTWYGAYVYDYKKNQEHYIGSLRFKGDKLTYGKEHASFIEVYGSKYGSEIPKVAVIFYEPKINGKYRKRESITINYPKHNLDNPPRFSYSKVENGKVTLVTVPSGLNDGKYSERY